MKHSATLAAFALAALIAAPALADEPSSISVSGEATISVAPDRASIEGGVTSEAKTAKEASSANNEAMGKVLLEIKSSGIADKDVQTTRLSLSPVYTSKAGTNGPGTITGYRASNRVIVRLSDVSKVAAVIDTLVKSGANEIRGINFSVEAASKLLDEARTKAVEDARRKAEIYARAAGVTLGAPLSISENGGSSSPPIAYRRMAAAPMMDGASVAQGEETLQVNVSVTWAINKPDK
jgi:uncharacterized protein YggE